MAHLVYSEFSTLTIVINKKCAFIVRHKIGLFARITQLGKKLFRIFNTVTGKSIALYTTATTSHVIIILW